MGISIGDHSTVPGCQWVKLVNPEPIANRHKTFHAGDIVSIEDPGRVTVVGINGEIALVRYDTPGDTWAAQCPSGGLFLLYVSVFGEWQRDAAAIAREREARQRIVEQLLAAEKTGTPSVTQS